MTLAARTVKLNFDGGWDVWGAQNLPENDFHFSLVRGGPLYLLQRRLWLIPADRDATGRRIAFFVAISWLPIVIVAVATGRAFGNDVAEPLVTHFALHARFLVALPLFFVAERVAESLLSQMVAHFRHSGLIRPGGETAFREALRATERQRDARLGTLIVAVAVAGVYLTETSGASLHEVAWAGVSSAGEAPSLALGVARDWYLLVSRPIFAAFAVLWLWRVAVLSGLFRRIARLDLALVATHPDRCAGLRFLDRLPFVLLPVVLGLSTVIASRLAHEILHHGESVGALKPIIAAWAGIAATLFTVPLLPLIGRLARLRRAALLSYGALVGRHGRLFGARWIEAGAHSDAELLAAPEISAAADSFSVYDRVAALQPVPVRDLVPFVALALLPFLPVVAIEIPVKDLLLRVLSAVA